MNRAPCQHAFLQHPCSLVELSIPHVLAKVINIRADVELLARNVVDIDGFSSYSSLKKPCNFLRHRTARPILQISILTRIVGLKWTYGWCYRCC
jgi:hypothetical protein